MSTTGGTPKGTVYVDEEPAAIVKKFKSAQTDSGREIVCADDKPGITNLIEILAVVRDATPADIEREFEGSRLRRRSSSAVGEEVAAWLAPSRERYLEMRKDDTAYIEALPRGSARRRPARSPRPSWRTCARPWASGPSAPPPSLRAVRLAAARAGSRRLRRPLRPAALADPARGAGPARGGPGGDRRHLPGSPRVARRAGPRVRDRVPGADRRAAGAQVAADAPGRGGRGAGRARARPRRPRSSSSGCCSTRASAAAGGHLAERHDARPVVPVPRRAPARGAAPGPMRHAGRLRPGRARRGARRAAADAEADRPLAHGDAARDRRRAPGTCCATCSAAARSRSTRRSRTPTASRSASRSSRCSSSTSAARPRWEQDEPFGEITVPPRSRSEAEARVNARRPPRGAALPRARPGHGRGARRRAADHRGGGHAGRATSSRPSLGRPRPRAARLAGGLALASHPDAEEAARRLLARPRTPVAHARPGRDARDRRLPAARVAAPRSPASAAWRPSRRPPRWPTAG